MENKVIDLFILFNEKESGVEKIVNMLEEMELKTYFWRRDIPIAAEWDKIEAQKMREAKSVLVFLGDFGWGPSHLPITIEAQKLKKRIIPVLIGSPPKEAFLEANSLFKSFRYIDMREINPNTIKVLYDTIVSIEPTQDESQFDRLINTIVDGNEEQRATLLQQIQVSETFDRASLSKRLRDEIQKKFSPDKQIDMSSAARDPNKIPSIRSWMLSILLWTDAEEKLNKDLLINHIQPTNEPDPTVRYWTLAGLYQKNVSYLLDALNIGLSEKEGVVYLLALAIQSPNSPSVIEKFKAALSSDRFEIVWQILRILRIVPIPQLVTIVCELLNKNDLNPNIAYDAFYALTNPEMTSEAVSILIIDPGIEGIVNRMISVVSGSNSNAIRNFAHMLLPFEENEVNSALVKARRKNTTRNIANQLYNSLVALRQKNAKGLYIAGYASDTINVTEDWLNIQEDVKTLTAVMMAKEVTPPLAIGLFGDWGSGKSYFMKSIQNEVQEIQNKYQDNPSSSFCGHVVQIDFNAWHYVDTNLWASLVSTIFEKLATYVSPGKSVEEQQAAFLSELGSTKIIVKEAEAEKQRAQCLIEERQSVLLDLQSKREQKEISLKDLRIQDIQGLLDNTEKFKLNKTLNEIGLPATLNNIADLNTVLSEAYTVKGRLTALFFQY